MAEINGVERAEASIPTPRLLNDLLAEEKHLMEKYKTKLPNKEEARADAINYGGMKIGWHRIAPYFATEDDPVIDDYTDWDLITEDTMNGNWDSMKTILHRYADESRRPGVEDEDMAQAYQNLADSL